MAEEPALLTRLADAVADTARRWRCGNRVAATVWWYMASSDVIDHVLRTTGDSAPTLRSEFETTIAGLAQISDASAPALWAIATDSLANRLLDQQQRAIDIAAAIPQLPTPRFVTVGGRTFVRRASCCLIYETPAADMCTSCPKRPPAERARLLAELARHGR